MRQTAVKKALAEKQSAVKVRHLLRRGLGFKIASSGKAMKGNVLEVNLSSPYIGAAGSHDVDSIVARACKLAVSKFRQEKQVDHKTKFTFFSSIAFKSDGGDMLFAKSLSHSSEQGGEWFRDFTEKIDRMFQSAKIGKLSDFSLDFHFVVQPSGGSLGTDSRERESMLKKRTQL